MDIYNTDTEETVSINYQGIEDCGIMDDDVSYNDDAERYEADAETIDWWTLWADETAKADDLRAELIATYGADEVYTAIDRVGAPQADENDVYRYMTAVSDLLQQGSGSVQEQLAALKIKATDAQLDVVAELLKDVPESDIDQATYAAVVYLQSEEA